MNVLFVHGGPGFNDYLEPYFANVLPTDVKAHFYSQTRSENRTIDELVDELEEKVRAIGTPLVLVGHSFGATLALEWLRQHPRGASGLVMMSPCLHYRHFGEEADKELRRRGIAQGDLENVFFTAKEKGEGVPLLEKLMSDFMLPMFLNLQRSYLSRFDVLDVLKTLPIPVLNLYGTEDARVPAHLLQDLGKLNANIRAHAVIDAGHFPFLLPHYRQEVVAQVSEFVRSCK